MALWAALGNYVKNNHVAGLVWNSKGKVATVEDLTNFQKPSVNSVKVPPPPPLSMSSTAKTVFLYLYFIK